MRISERARGASARRAGAGRGTARPVLAIGVCLALGIAACNRTSERAPASTPLGQFVRGTTAEPTSLPPLEEMRPVDCPQVRIQPDTEVLVRDDGSGSASELRWQASITRTARECAREGEGVAIRVGLSGRVIEGAKGAPGEVELPLRIAVREGGEVTYSRLHSVRVAMTGPSQSWAFVDDQITVRQPRRARILVGFDG